MTLNSNAGVSRIFSSRDPDSGLKFTLRIAMEKNC